MHGLNLQRDTIRVLFDKISLSVYFKDSITLKLKKKKKENESFNFYVTFIFPTTTKFSTIIKHCQSSYEKKD